MPPRRASSTSVTEVLVGTFIKRIPVDTTACRGRTRPNSAAGTIPTKITETANNAAIIIIIIIIIIITAAEGIEREVGPVVSHLWFCNCLFYMQV